MNQTRGCFAVVVTVVLLVGAGCGGSSSSGQGKSGGQKAYPPPTPPTEVVPPPTKPECGAPANPYGYNFCSRGSLIHTAPVDTCSYFTCIGNFRSGKGYLVECTDGTFSMSGGRKGACSNHKGEGRPVYSGP